MSRPSRPVSRVTLVGAPFGPMRVSVARRAAFGAPLPRSTMNRKMTPASSLGLSVGEAVLQIQAIRQSSNLPLFRYSSVSVFTGLRVKG